MTFLQLALGYVIGRVLVSVLFIPAYFRGELLTSYELLQRRFGRASRPLSAGIFLVTRSLADGIRLFATALVIGVVTGVPVTWTTLVLGAVMIVYTVRGGVVGGDLDRCRADVRLRRRRGGGGLGAARAHSRRLGRGRSRPGRRPASSRSGTCRRIPSTVYTLWTGLLGGVALTLATHGTDQFLVQRLLARDQRPGRRDRPGAERRSRVRAVHAVPLHRRDALHLLPARAAAARARPHRRDPADRSSSIAVQRRWPASSSRRSSPQRCRRH